MPRCPARLRHTSWSPRLRPYLSLSHPSGIQRQAGQFPGPLLSYGHEQKTPKRDSSVPPLLLARVNATAHQRAHPLPRGWPHAGPWPPTAAGWLSHLQQVHKLPGVLQHNAGSCGRQNLGRTSPNLLSCSLKQTFIYAAGSGTKIARVPSLPSVIFFHVQS